MKQLFIILIIADIVLTMVFLPWGMLVNAAILVISLLIIWPVFYYKLFKKEKK